MAETSPQNFWTGWKQRFCALRNIPPVLRIVWASGRLVIAAGLLLRIVAALIPVTMLSVSRVIIDTIVATTSGRRALLPIFWWLVALEFGLAALGAVLGRSVWFCDSLFADRFARHVSIRVMEHASTLDLAAYEDPAFYDKLERARVQATDRVAMIQAAGTMLQQIIIAATLSASILVFSPLLLLVMILCLVPAFLGESHFAFLGYSLNFCQTPVRRQLDYLRQLGASKESAKELKLFGLNSFLVQSYSKLSSRIYCENVALARRRLVVGAFLSLLSTTGYYGTYAYVMYRTVRGDLTVGTMTFLAGAIAGASANIQNIFSLFSNIADQSLFLTDLLEFFAVRPRIRSQPHALPAPRPISGGFEFRDVCFTYPGAARLILDHLDFRLEQGERVALIGENGQGKTTLVKLLTRLYDPTSGRILLDGVDLREYSIEDLHREIGVIFQDYMRYEMSAADNIAIGRLEQRHNLSKLRYAACKSMADGVIERLPRRYQQMLGRRFDGGVDLSGGEWQKIALARAYLRDAQLLILDEPTASLDARSEHEVFQRFTDLTTGKMALLISHRFSTVRMSDRIVVLEGGRIVEPGSHSQLVSLGGRYCGSGAKVRVAGDDEEMQRFVPIEDLFKGRHFDGQIIILCVAWYTSFKLSLRDLMIMMADRGISVTHTTILRWVQRYLPEFEKRWWRYARPVGGSWRMDETYIKVHGQWVYLYRAVDKAGQTVDFFLSRNRDVNAAKSFLRSAMKHTRVPTKITLDAYAASHRAVREMKEDGELPRKVKVRPAST